MNPQHLYDLTRSEHQLLVTLSAEARTYLPAERRHRWWHAVWRPPHARRRSVVPTVPAPLQLR